MDDAAENRQRGGEKEEGKRRRTVGKVKTEHDADSGEKKRSGKYFVAD